MFPNFSMREPKKEVTRNDKRAEMIQDNADATWIAIKIARRLLLINEYKEKNDMTKVSEYQLDLDYLLQELKRTGCR